MSDREAALHFERLYLQEHIGRSHAQKALHDLRNTFQRMALGTTSVPREDAEQAFHDLSSRLRDLQAQVEAHLATPFEPAPVDLATMFTEAVKSQLHGERIVERSFPINIVVSDNIPRDTVLLSNGVRVWEFRLVDGGKRAELRRELELGEQSPVSENFSLQKVLGRLKDTP
jgi:hypothetical protein